MHIKILKSLFKTHKEKFLFGRYITTDIIKPILENLPSAFKVCTIGKSVNDENIYSVSIGNGRKNVLIWSQMHGSESTTTKALFDFFNFLSCSPDSYRDAFSNTIMTNCTLMIIPMLNPDGALAYKRFNANNVDLNRDAQDLSQPESIVLRQCFNDFKPDYCFNLHDQRTIFSAGKTNNPATVSFLSPSQDKSCSLTKNRTVAMEIIGVMNAILQKQIPNQVAIYDDAFNINCTGDMFQSQNVPTILFEAGHYKNDYKREKTREFIFQSLIVSLRYIAINSINGDKHRRYYKIPKNENYFFDIIIRNSTVSIKNKERIFDIGILYEERLINDSIKFIPIINKISDLSKYFGHKEIDAKDARVLLPNLSELKAGYEIDFVLINNTKFSLIL